MLFNQDEELKLCDSNQGQDGRAETMANLEHTLGRLSLSTIMSYLSDSGDFGIDELNGKTFSALQKERAKHRPISIAK